MAREFQRSLEQAANEAGMSEMQKSLRSIDQSLDAATSSARKFATRRCPSPDASSEALGDRPAAAPRRRGRGGAGAEAGGRAAPAAPRRAAPPSGAEPRRTAAG